MTVRPTLLGWAGAGGARPERIEMQDHGSPRRKNRRQAEARLRCPICLAVFRTWFDCCPVDGAVLARLEGDPLLGTEVAGRYVIEELVGEGSMGLIYRARHVSLPRRFAVKILFGDLVADPRMRMRFTQEAALASRLNHPHVIPVVDFGRTTSGLLYLVMDFVKGETLSDLIAREAPLDQVHVIRLARQLAQGLGHAHKRGVVHRDFKPSNVLLEPHENGPPTARILDFGLAISIHDREDVSGRLTELGFIIGTPVYIAPEQVLDRAVDHRADLFALGVVMYEMLAGQPPFDGRPVEIAHKNVVEQVPPMARRTPGVEVTPELERIVWRLLAKEPANRFGSTDALCGALDAVEGLVLSRPTLVTERVADDLEDTVIERDTDQESAEWLPAASHDQSISSQRGTRNRAGKLAVGAASIFAAGVLAYALSVRCGRTGPVTPEQSMAVAEAATAPAPVPGTGAVTLPAGTPLVHPLPGDESPTGGGPGRTDPMSREQVRAEQPTSRDAAVHAATTHERARRRRRADTGAGLARGRTPPDPGAPSAERPDPGTESKVLPAPDGTSPAEQVRPGKSAGVDGAGAPSAPASSTPGSLSQALSGVQAPPVAETQPTDDPARTPALAPARPPGPILVPPSRTRREGGHAPAIRFPRGEQVPRQLVAKLCIDPRGRVTSITVLSPVSASARGAVERALSGLRYRPVVEQGEKVAACFAPTFRVQVD